MTTFIPVRQMEDFTVHPTYISNCDSKIQYARQYTPPGSPSTPAYLFKQTIKTPDRGDMTRDLIDLSMFGKSYDSDEELASPVDIDDDNDDSLSMISDADESDFSSSEQFSDSYSGAADECNKAQAVVLLRANKVRVISVPKRVTIINPGARISQESQRGDIRDGASEMSRSDSSQSIPSTEGESRTESNDESDITSPASSIVELTPPPKSLRRKPLQDMFANMAPRPGLSTRRGSIPVSFPVPRSKPLMEAASGISPSPTSTPRSADFLKQQDSQLSDSPSSAPNTPARRRIKKISSSLSLNRFGSNKSRPQQRSGNDSGSELESIKEPEPLFFSSASPRTAMNSAGSKLVPRGANERAPPIILPPCPDDSDDENDASGDSDYPARYMRKNSVGYAAAAASRAVMRQRSMSVDLKSSAVR